MIARLVAVLQSDTVAVAMAALAISVSLKTIADVAERRAAHLGELEDAIAARRAELADLEAPLSPAPVGSYPAREDLDPLAAGED